MPATDKAEQTELTPTAHVKFTNTAASALDTPAELGDVQMFTVVAKCTGEGTELRKDGEIRTYRKMEVLDVEFGQITKSPADPQLALVDDEN